jgi:hypothetical protein
VPHLPTKLLGFWHIATEVFNFLYLSLYLFPSLSSGNVTWVKKKKISLRSDSNAHFQGEPFSDPNYTTKSCVVLEKKRRKRKQEQSKKNNSNV